MSFIKYLNFCNKTAIKSLIRIFSQSQEFPWSYELQGFILSSFFYGYTSTQLLGGWLASHIGGKRIFGFGIAITALSTMFISILLKVNVSLLILIRVIQGICEVSPTFS